MAGILYQFPYQLRRFRAVFGGAARRKAIDFAGFYASLSPISHCMVILAVEIKVLYLAGFSVWWF